VKEFEVRDFDCPITFEKFSGKFNYMRLIILRITNVIIALVSGKSSAYVEIKFPEI